MPETISEAVPAVCVEVIRQFWDHFDDPSSVDESATVRPHVDECAHCRGFERFQVGYRDAMRSVRLPGVAPWHVRARCWMRWRLPGFVPRGPLVLGPRSSIER